MDSRERVLTALNHEEPDRMPRDMGGNNVGILPSAQKKLFKHMGVNWDVCKDYRPQFDEFMDYFKIDFRRTWSGFKPNPKIPK
ncbi:MAG: hypothetical protein ABIA63_05015, partial [bacterium]